MNLDPVTGNLSISNATEAVSGIFYLINTYTGALGSFSLQNNVSITITGFDTTSNTTANSTTETNENNEKDSDEYCLGASSKGLCGFYVFLIIAGVILPLIFILVFVYIKCKKASSSRQDASKVEQDEVEERNNNSRDESVPLDQHNDDIPDANNQEADLMKRGQENQV